MNDYDQGELNKIINRYFCDYSKIGLSTFIPLQLFCESDFWNENLPTPLGESLCVLSVNEEFIELPFDSIRSGVVAPNGDFVN
jgi:hypothetical protein